MGSYLNPGSKGFQESLNSEIYVDKTGLIEKTNAVLDTRQKFLCVSRPRRFGKSMAADMLAAYYERGEDADLLFRSLKISKAESYRAHLNQYDVIKVNIQEFLSMTGSMDEMLSMLKKYLVFDLMEHFDDVRFRDESNLIQVMKDIYAKMKRAFVILIDEWDCLFREYQQDQDSQKKYLDFLRAWLKDKEYVALAYMTGILPIKKYGTQSAMTDFREYTMLAPKKLAEYVGFTETEVQDLCTKYGMDFEEMKRWYDGYSFSRAESVYNPNSVIEAIKSEEIGNYWTQTETYASLQFYIDMDEDGLKETIAQMLGGAHIKIDSGTFQNDMTTIRSRDDVLTLLVHLGYLAYDFSEKSVYIPNEEIREEFVRAVTVGKHTEIAKLLRDSEHLLEATLNMDEEAVATLIEEAHKASVAPTFYNNEQALRSVIRVAYISCVDEFLRIEELPSGHGYADVVFIPKRTSLMPLMVIELKWNKTDEGAIRQIKNHDYPQVMKDYGGEILLVGINYDSKNKKHTCTMESYKK